MILLLDQGNSRLKWAMSSTASWQSGAARDVLSMETDATPDRILLASVAGEPGTGRLIQQIQQKWSLTPEVISVQSQAHGITNCYQDCTQMGVDRWLAVIAAYRQFPRGALVIDAGTALTLDTVDATGRMLGGAIMPGPGLMLSALTGGAANINISHHKPFEVPQSLEDTTEKTVRSGIEQGFIGAADRLIASFRQRLSTGAGIVVTGGWAKILLNHLNHDMMHRPDLVLEGLAVVAKVERQ